MSDIVFASACQLAQMIRDRTISSVEAVDAYLAQISNHNSTLNAICTIVARLRAAGAVILGKTNLAELAGDFQSTNSLFPRVNNPWNLDYTAGSSSGGSAAAVAAGLSPLDIGNDIAGSVRQPAHFCGIYGLKPTDCRISTAGVIPEVPGMPYCLRQMITVGCFARSLQGSL